MRASAKYHSVDQKVHVSPAYDGYVADVLELQVHAEQLQLTVYEKQIALYHRNTDLMCSKKEKIGDI